MPNQVKIINLEEALPSRAEALQRLEVIFRELPRNGTTVVKIIHGYGSSGAGGVLRFAVRNFLRKKKDAGEITLFVNGESLSSFDGRSKTLLAKCPPLLLDRDLGAGNKGVTLALL